MRALGKRFGDRVALDAIDVTIPAGGIHAILGRNGSGKSTLFRVAATLLAPDSGTVEVLGIDARFEPDRVRRAIGVVFQKPSLDGKLTALENLCFAGRIHGLGRAEARSRAREELERLAILDRADDRVDALSGGLARRVEIAKALVPRPELLLLDEPSTGLDPIARSRLQERLRALAAAGVTILLTTHLLDEAEECATVTILDRGRVVACGDPRDLEAALGGAVITVRGTDPAAARAILARATGATPDSIGLDARASCADPAAAAARVAAELGRDLLRLEIARPSLAEVFARATGREFRAFEETP